MNAGGVRPLAHWPRILHRRIAHQLRRLSAALVRISSRRTDYDGLEILYATDADLAAARDALDFLRTVDLRRFRRLKRYVRTIAISRNLGDSHVAPVGVVLDVGHATTPAVAAEVLVHETVHCLIDAWVGSEPNSSRRVESLCTREQLRFRLRCRQRDGVDSVQLAKLWQRWERQMHDDLDGQWWRRSARLRRLWRDLRPFAGDR